MADRKWRVLLVDDEPGIVKLVGKRLEVAGYEVVTALDGEEGLTKARLGRPDAVILDLMLPIKNGMEVCAELKADAATKAIPIIMFTARHEAMDEKLCRECGADAYITKSQQSKALLEQLEALLTRVLARPARLQQPADA